MRADISSDKRQMGGQNGSLESTSGRQSVKRRMSHCSKNIDADFLIHGADLKFNLSKQSQTPDCGLAPRNQKRSKWLTLYIPKYKHILHEKQHRRRKNGRAEGVDMMNMVWWTVWDLEHDTIMEQF